MNTDGYYVIITVLNEKGDTMFVKLKDLLQENDYTVTNKEVEKAFQNAGYASITKSHDTHIKNGTKK